MTDIDMAPLDGRITTDRLDHVLAIGIDRPWKLNGFSPKMLIELAEAFTALERDEEAWVGVLFADGTHFTAGLSQSAQSTPYRCGRRSGPSRSSAPCRVSVSRSASS